ncbi:hypothetical protein H9Q09_01185 [Aurantimonas sp. DM33-3]|uniref:hypothetical protein n=1 Tax=Aurantimonas sp. DM33-3 TaxID=2766955 RepID=UPI001652A0DC|nr:hypothetical protein [Aurantimonas sp. DM33-3]MBC6714799.1 hypothetical protein [Aurantimonas sp. DM33-3]
MALPVYHTNTNTDAVAVYTVPADKVAAVSVNIAALLANKAKIAITSGAAPTAANWLETQVAMAVGTVLERTGIVLPAGHKIWITSDVANAVSVQVYGIEEAA